MLDEDADDRIKIGPVIEKLVAFIRSLNKDLIEKYFKIEQYYYSTLTQESDPVSFSLRNQYIADMELRKRIFTERSSSKAFGEYFKKVNLDESILKSNFLSDCLTNSIKYQ